MSEKCDLILGDCASAAGEAIFEGNAENGIFVSFYAASLFDWRMETDDGVRHEWVLFSGIE
jgi:hypothetical protein